MRHTRTVSWMIGVSFFGFISLLAIGFLAKMDVVVRAPGEIRPIKYAEVRPPVEGLVQEVFKHEGDDVRAGDVILKMDTRSEELEREKVRREIERLTGDLADRERKRSECAVKLDLAKATEKAAEADIASRKADLEKASVNLKQAEASPDSLEFRNAEERLKQQAVAVRDAEKALDDAKTLFDKGMVSEQNLTKAQSALETAQSEYRVRENAIEIHRKTKIGADLEKAKSEMQAHKAALEGALARLEERRNEVKLSELAAKDESETRRIEAELAKNKLAEARLTGQIEEKLLRAPVDGILYDFHAKPGQTVTHKERTAWIFDTGGFLFYARAQQIDLPGVEKGQQALLYLDALPYRLEGTWDAEVAELSQVAAPPTGNSGESILPVAGGSNTPEGLIILLVKRDPRNAQLRVGFTGQTEIVIGRASVLEVLFGHSKTAGKQ
ncbi:MAG: HlyD family efflux transporter periplasmic adaptor subunit [Planctomycetota bacterium]|nr:HlyD family efflux transporter periplasmic adaptor subunit [Planctomycetota bacterium]